MSSFLTLPNAVYQIQYSIWLVNDLHWEEVRYRINRRALSKVNIVVTCTLFPRQIGTNSRCFGAAVTGADLAAGTLPEFDRLLSFGVFSDLYRDRVRKDHRLRSTGTFIKPGWIEEIYAQIAGEFSEAVCPSWRHEDLYGSGDESYEYEG
jgi:hypothetical protein